MSAAVQRYLVSGFDFDVYDIVVEARSVTEAVLKANRLYEADGLGYTAAHCAPSLRLVATPATEALS